MNNEKQYHGHDQPWGKLKIIEDHFASLDLSEVISP